MKNDTNSVVVIAQVFFQYNNTQFLKTDSTLCTLFINDPETKIDEKRRQERNYYFSSQSKNLSNNISLDEINRSLSIGIEAIRSLKLNPQNKTLLICNSFLYLAKNWMDSFGNVKPQNLFEWKKISLIFGSEIFRSANRALYSLIGEKVTPKALRNKYPENHAHLWASAPIFNLTWLDLMNWPIDHNIRIKKLGINSDLLFNHKNYTHSYISPYFEHELLLAATIRIYIFAHLTNRLDKTSIQLSIKRLLNYPTTSAYEQRKIAHSIQTHLHNLKSPYDYCNLLIDPGNKVNDTMTGILGEEEFLYKCFLEFNTQVFDIELLHYFHLYIVIKTRLRAELVQSNQRTGFSNFYQYQLRKSAIFDLTGEFLELSTFLALKHDENVDSKEVRIAPKKSQSKLKTQTQYIDRISTKSLTKSGRLQYRRSKKEKEKYDHFYTLHFSKKSSEKWKKSEPRNHTTRQNLEPECTAIYKELNSKHEKIRRIFGIDAASSEYDCRPEVFATAYRFLSINPNSDTRNAFRTYHVGEDFADIVDGMRAIDEVLLFLYPTPKKSDRIGHALACGLNVTEWYHSKSLYLRKRRQDHLDDLLFLIRTLRHQSNVPPQLLDKLLSEFNQLCTEIYPSIIQVGFAQVDIYEKAYLLRADCPSLYTKGHYEPSRRKKDPWANSKISNYTNLAEYRKQSDVVSIYYKYHYEQKTRSSGDQLFDFYVYPEYLAAADLCQAILLEKLRKINMKIEANPSSNFLIAKMKNYGDHPIFKWFPIEETKDRKLSVSINTDDAGIFDTNLKLEYDLIKEAALLKKPIDVSDKLYKKQVGQWISKIVKNSRDQTFRKQIINKK